MWDYFSPDSDDSKSQISALTQTEEDGRPKRKRVGEAGSETSSLLDDGAQIKSDKALMDTFVKVLSQGITVKMYGTKDKAPKEVTLTLSGTTLQWKVTNSRSILAAFKTNKLDVKQIKTIEWGKHTAVFSQPVTEQLADEVCLSLVTADRSKTLDFELSSKVERDSVAQGFSILINSLNFDDSAAADDTANV